MKFADQRKQYKQSQDAMIANEAIVKGIRRQLATHMRTKATEIEALLPPVKGPRHLTIAMLDTSERHGAAFQPFGIRVQGMKSWHVLDAKQERAITSLMKKDGWNTIGLQQTSTGSHWFIDFV